MAFDHRTDGSRPRSRPDPSRVRSVVLGVTADKSVGLLRGFPAYLAANGWSVHVVSSSGPLSDELSREPGVEVHRIEMERGLSPTRDLSALVAWVRLLSRLRPDVSYVGTPKAGLLSALAGVVARVPSRVYLLRGLRAEGLRFPQARVLNLLERLAVRCVDEVVCVSPSLRRAARDARVLRAKEGIVLGAGSSNGVRTDLQPPTPSERLSQRTRYFACPDQFTLGFVGRVTRDKGIDTLAAALLRLTQVGLTGNCLVVGGDDSREGSALRAALDGSGWSVRHLDQVADVVPALTSLDVLCLPSRREGFPNVVLEAAMVGVPCVGSQATGMVDAIVHNGTGLTVPIDDDSALAQALARLMRNSDEVRRLGLAARRRAMSYFGREQVWATHADFLASLPGTSSTTQQPNSIHV